MIWKRLIEFDDVCEVSDTGLIKVNGQIKKGTVDTKGYLQVWVDGKLRMAHRLVALGFIPNPDNLPQVNHKDENKLNNNVDNLEWCTNIYNANYGTRTQRQVATAYARGSIYRPTKRKKILCVELEKVFESYKEAASFFNVDKSMISSVARGKSKTCKGYTFKNI